MNPMINKAIEAIPTSTILSNLDDVLSRAGLMRISRQSIGVMPLAAAFTAGAIVGGVGVALTTPMSGDQLRKRILDELQKLRTSESDDETDEEGETSSDEASANGSGSYAQN